MTSTNNAFYRSSAASSRSTSPSPPPLFPGMVHPQDPPPYTRRSNHPTNVNGNGNVREYTLTPNGHSLSSSNFYSSSNTSASVRSSTLAAVAASAAALVKGVRGKSNGSVHGSSETQSSTPFTPRHNHSLSNSSTASDLPSALVDKQFVYYPSTSASSRLRSLRKRLFTKRALGYYLILALIAFLLLFYLQPSIPLWKNRRSVDSQHHSSNRERHRYDYDYDYDYPLDKSRQRAKELEHQRVSDQENKPWKQEQGGHNDSERHSGEQTPDQPDKADLDQSYSHGSNSDLGRKGIPPRAGDTIDPESIVLYRILGNDLPPRHRPGQTLSNVRFILEHEPEFEKTRKLWVLNRIVDQHAEEAIIQLLDHHRQEYIRVPFEENEYLKQDFRLEDFPEPDFFSSDDYSTFSKVAKLRVLDYTYHDKNKYAMNNNGGRNIAIQHGKTKVEARWIFAFDGNSFLTKNAMNEIKLSIRDYGDTVKYFVVPMARLVDNSQLLKGVDTRPNSKEEPQIIFRNDATDMYNTDMRYGRRSKLELLWRLGALERGKISKPSVSWEPKEREPIPNKADFKTVGWVFRLFSGKRSQEENTRQSAAIRAYNRLLAIQDLIDGIDERIARKTFRPSDLLVYKDSVLRANRQKYWIGESGVTIMVQELQTKACEVLSKRLNLLKKASAEDLILYPGDSQGKPIIPPSSSVNIANEDGSSKIITLQGLYDEVTTLTLAHYFTGNETFARAAANIVRTTLLQERDQYVAVHPTVEETGYLLDHGYSFPALNRLPRIIPKKEGAIGSRPLLTIPKDLLKADTMPAFLDAVRMLHRVHVLTQNEYIQLNLVFSTWLEHLVNSPEGIMYARQGDHRSSFMDLHVAALSAITDDVRLFLRVVNRCRMRVGRQFMVVQDGKIKMPFENAYATRQSMEGLLQPGGAAADVSGQELAGMYLDEENDELDLSLDQSISRPRDLGFMMKDSVMANKAPNSDAEKKVESSENDDDDDYQKKRRPDQDLTDQDVTDDEDDGFPAKPQEKQQQQPLVASSTPPLVPEGSGEPIYTVAELTERYSTLNLQYWTLLTRMVDNSGMSSAPDLWRHRSKRGYRLGDIVRNYVRQDHYRSPALRKVTMDALLYTARRNYDHVPSRALLTMGGSSSGSSSTLAANDRQKVEKYAKPFNPANVDVLEWGDLGLEANTFEALATDENDFKDSLGGSLPGTGVPPFWMLGVVE
ncbi:hypothetical protein BX616_001808 [Lobosporangium transversale]|uniref:Alginate lyase domain-containing protein n=1 Tax=Lobosporangium transversale TaxID=64571 RepID=A0A1Y2H0J9_9FUNG|nr:hypothetical protein BCR41DRAFT_383352 [Lobosporangium transversale]KAF9902789.1 hypothetical protein BX616_001808 [Lobosporangium transversale]ORZ27574.1 hypothetical protein BCR41DRAFT_383352 [Lobosporangium transversale]|eukprot:XP_021885277.1 hypothetical protein BCR41DRAFT_383352 [Lobosporangium transversale]